MTQIVRAPGSLFLAGEYAVLVGGVAVIAAVDRYATARRGRDGFKVENRSFDSDALPIAVCDVLGIPTSGIHDVVMNVDGFYRDDTKLGLSSSAASTVALAKLLKPSVTEDEVVDAHNRFQGKKGSGADVRAAFRGGVWAMRPIRPEPPFLGADKIGIEPESKIRMPDWLEIRAVWLGKPASTANMIAGLYRNLDRSEVQDILISIHDFAGRFYRSLQGESLGACLTAFSYCRSNMELLGNECGLPIVIDAHRELARSLPHPFVAKPSGAGGGDFSLVAGPSDADWDALGIEFEPLKFGVEAEVDF